MTIPPRPDLYAGTRDGGGGGGLRGIGRDGRGVAGADHGGARNASFGVYAARHDLHYIVDEQTAGRIGVHRHGPAGWQMLAAVATGGAEPCHVALDPAQTLLAVANYAGGSVSLFRLDAHGMPTGPVQVRAHRGAGPDPQRQAAPHAHWVGFGDDGRWLYQTDLGTDEILAFAVDPQGGLGTAQRAYRAPPGSGPRHVLLHPTQPGRAYLASELASTLTVLDRAGARFTARAILSTLPADWRGDSIVAHIAMNRAGDRLYVSNRGHDSIAVFALDGAGWPTLIQHAPAGGAFPRFFLLLEDRQTMIVANEASATVTMLAIAADGRLFASGAPLAVPGVAWILTTG